MQARSLHIIRKKKYNTMKSLGKGSISIILILFIILSNASAQDPPTDYSESDLLGKGISSTDVAKLMALTPELRSQRVQEMDNILKHIQDNGLQYTVGYTDKFLLPDSERDKLAGVKGPQPSISPTSTPNIITPPSALPASFDLRNNNGVTPIRDQGYCGSCWAHAALAAVEGSSKYLDGTVLDLSEQDLVTCWPGGSGCAGAWPEGLFVGTGQYDSWLKNMGVVDEACFPYVSSFDCNAKCSNPAILLKIKEGYSLSAPPNEDDIKNAVYNYGPVVMAHSVPPSFSAYTGGIYECDTGGLSHATVIIGWSSDSGTDYWIAKNSWGTSWGESGFYKIKRGTCYMYLSSMQYAEVDDTTPTTQTTQTTLPVNKCTDTDGGKKWDVFGTATGVNGIKDDMCKGRIRLKEAFCKKKKSKYKTHKCGGKCDSGVCVDQGSCVDTDGGKVYDVFGSATDEFRTRNDKCKGRKKIREAFCNPYNKAVYKVKKCPHKCKQGVCI